MKRTSRQNYALTNTQKLTGREPWTLEPCVLKILALDRKDEVICISVM